MLNSAALDPIIAAIRALQALPRMAARWATVTQQSPLRIRYDGEADALVLTPVDLVGGLTVDQRVWTITWSATVYIIAAKPTPWTALNVLTGAGFSGSAKYRRVGGRVDLRFDISGTVPNANTALTEALPAAFRPTNDGTTLFPAPSYIDPAAARASAVAWYANDTATLRATAGGGTSVTRLRGHVDWVLG